MSEIKREQEPQKEPEIKPESEQEKIEPAKPVVPEQPKEKLEKKPEEKIEVKPESTSTESYGETKQELSPEIIEKIMEKVQDINSEQTLYHAIVGGSLYFKHPDSIRNFSMVRLRNELKHGYVTSYISSLESRSAWPGLREKEWLALLKKSKESSPQYAGERENEVLKSRRFLRDSMYMFLGSVFRGGKLSEGWMRWYEKDVDKIVLLFDTKKLIKRKIVTPSDVSSRGGRGGIWLRGSGRIAPRYFSGIVFDVSVIKSLPPKEVDDYYREQDEIKRLSMIEETESFLKTGLKKGVEESNELKQLRQEVDEKWNDVRNKFKGVVFPFENFKHTSNKDPEARRKKAKELLSIMMDVNKDRPDRFLPIYDADGNMWWPLPDEYKEQGFMPYEEVKKFVEKRDAKKLEDKNELEDKDNNI